MENPRSSGAEIDLRYVAGFFDGEGCVCASWNKPYDRATITVSVSQKNPEVLWLIQQFWGFGSVQLSKTNTAQWSVSNAEHILKALQLMLPHLVVKKEVATLGIALCERIVGGVGRSHVGSGAPLLDAEQEIRMSLVARVHQLNSRKGNHGNSTSIDTH